MKRPDQDRFDQHSRHFELIDDELEQFCCEHGFHLVKNMYHTPCRVLMRAGNPQQSLEVYQEDNWLETEYREDLPHTFAVTGFYEPPQDNTFVFKKAVVLAAHKPFSEIQPHLTEYLQDGLKILDSWTPETIISSGQRLENLKKKYMDMRHEDQ